MSGDVGSGLVRVFQKNRFDHTAEIFHRIRLRELAGKTEFSVFGHHRVIGISTGDHCLDGGIYPLEPRYCLLTSRAAVYCKIKNDNIERPAFVS